MPPEASAGASEGTSSTYSMILNGVQLTPAESKIAAAILEIHASRLDIDWSMVSDKTGHKTPKQTRDAWRLVKIKTGLNADAGAPGSSTPTSVKKTAPAKSAATQTGEDGTPVKRGRGRPPKAKPTLMLTPGAGGDDSPALSTPGTALGNMSLGDMTPETPSKVGSGVKRSAEEADPDAIFEDTPAKKKAAPRKRLTAEQKAVQKVAEVEAANQAANQAKKTVAAETIAALIPAGGFEPASSPVGNANGAIGEGDSINVKIAMTGISEAEQAIHEILAADAAEAADLVGGIDPGEI